jgi:hypothetical protein
MRSDLSEHYCWVQKGMKNHIRVIWTHNSYLCIKGVMKAFVARGVSDITR